MAQVLKGVVDPARGFAMIIPVALARDGELQPTFSEAMWENAFLDTGATHSMMTPPLISELGLVGTGDIQYNSTPTGLCAQELYRFDIGMRAEPQPGCDNVPFYRTVRHCGVTEIPLPIGGCRLVVGMDILTTTGLTLLPNGDFYLYL
jgi:hypothetical protein